MKQLAPMPRPSRSWLPVLVVLLACIIVPLHAEIVERVIVKVNGEIFTKTDLETRQTAALRGQNVQMGNDAELKKRIEEVTPQILVDAVDEMLLLQRGKEKAIKMSDDDFSEILKKLKADNKIETEEQFQQALKSEGLTVDQLRRQIERRFIIERLEGSEVFTKLSVSENEARHYYDEHKSEFTTQPTVTLREILVRVPANAPGADEEAKLKADNIRVRALKGESFEKLAADLSDAPSKASGGLLGVINTADLSPNFADRIKAMKAGDVSEPIRTATGYDIVKLEAATPAVLRSFEEARGDVANRVYQAKQRVEFEAYLNKLRASAIIDWKVPELKKLYDEQVARGRAPIEGGPTQ